MREYLVHDPAGITDEMIDIRYRASLDPEVVANPPLRRPSGPSAPRTLLRMDLTRDPRLRRITHPTLVIWGTEDRVNRPPGRGYSPAGCRTAMSTCRQLPGIRSRASGRNSSTAWSPRSSPDHRNRH